MAVGFGVALLQLTTAAQDKPAPTNVATNAPKLSPQEQKDRWSYAIGMNIGNSIKRGGVELDIDALSNAIKDVLAGHEPKITDQQAQEAFRSYQMESRSKQEELKKVAAEKNKKEGDAFLAENKTKPGVKTVEVKLADGTTAEMQYKVITEGTGAIPKTNETVSVNYKGTLINGKEFDSSVKRGQPAEFPLGQVLPCWAEGIGMMKVGGKAKLVCPSEIAYGDRGRPPIIPGGATLIFEVELLDVKVGAASMFMAPAASAPKPKAKK